MGFYLGSSQMSRLSVSPTVTSREYVSILSTAIRNRGKSPAQGSEAYERGALYLAAGRPRPAAQAFSKLVDRQPDDPAAHMMLGVAHLSAGDVKAALRHLEDARRLVGARLNADVSLYSTLEDQLEAALIRLFLIRVYSMLGMRRAVKRLISDGLIL